MDFERGDISVIDDRLLEKGPSDIDRDGCDRNLRTFDSHTPAKRRPAPHRRKRLHGRRDKVLCLSGTHLHQEQTQSIAGGATSAAVGHATAGIAGAPCVAVDLALPFRKMSR